MGFIARHRRRDSLPNRRLPLSLAANPSISTRRLAQIKSQMRPYGLSQSTASPFSQIHGLPNRRPMVQILKAWSKDQRFRRPIPTSRLFTQGVKTGFTTSAIRGISKLSSRQLICIRRAQRKEVLNAKGLTGKVGQKRPVFNESSKVVC